MPTPLPGGEKTAFINIVKVVNPLEVPVLTSIMNNYEDVATAIGRSIVHFGRNNAFLMQALGAITSDAALNAVGIYRNAGLASLMDAKMAINFNVTTAITITASVDSVAIIGNSSIKKIILNTGVNVKYLYIGPGSTVDIVDATAAGASINYINLVSGKGLVATLRMAELGSQLGDINVDYGSYFGGFKSTDPGLACANPVTNLAFVKATNNRGVLVWTKPAAWLLIDVFFRLSQAPSWTPVKDEHGNYNGDDAFVFSNLEKDTYYDFKVVVTCLNGGQAETIITGQTVCCGSGGGPIYDICKIKLTIKDVPDPNPLTNIQTICNGETMAKEFVSGPTLTIPILVGRRVLSPFIVDNGNATDVAYDENTGTFDASVSTLTTFAEPNKIEFNALMPI